MQERACCDHSELGPAQQGDRAQRFQRLPDLGRQRQGPLLLNLLRKRLEHALKRAVPSSTASSIRRCGADRGQCLGHRCCHRAREGCVTCDLPDPHSDASRNSRHSPGCRQHYCDELIRKRLLALVCARRSTSPATTLLSLASSGLWSGSPVFGNRT